MFITTGLVKKLTNTMIIIYHLLFRDSYTRTPTSYFFSDISNIVEFLNQHENRWGLHVQTVVCVELDTNQRHPIYIDRYEQPCDTFEIDRNGNATPLNIYNFDNPS